MWIKKITIKNLCAFENEVILDLNPNPNGIDNDLNHGKIRKIGEHYFLPVIAIGGANATGKTSILKALKVFAAMVSNHFSDDLIYKAVQFAINEIEPSLLTNISWFKQEFNKINFGIAISSNLSLTQFNIDFITKHFHEEFQKVFLPDLDLKIKKILSKTCNLIKDNNIRFWLENKHFKNKPSSLEIEFYDQQFSEFEVQIDDQSSFNTNNILKIEQLNFSYTKNKQNSLFSSELMNEFGRYLNNWYFEENNHIPDQINYFELINLIKTFGKESFIKVLQIADPNVQDLKMEKKSNDEIVNIWGVILKDGAETSLGNLSRGTKRFITFLNLFTTQITKNVSGLIAIDEIENYLHYRLVDFLKRYIYANTNTQWQLILTSHNPIALTSLMSNKQIFFIDYENNKKVIKKVSSLIRTSNSALKMLIERKIGSSPDENTMNDVLYNDLIKE